MSLNPFSIALFAAATFFTVLVLLYSIGSMREKRYYVYVLMTYLATSAAFFADDYLALLIAWGIVGIMLYLLIGMGGEKAAPAAQKTLIIVGGSDALMVFGAGLVLALTGTLKIGAVRLPLDSLFPVLAFLALACGALAKAGAIPFHGWITDSAETAPVSVMAFLPASLDKLLGIYLLSRLCFDAFWVKANSPVSLLLLAVGSLTVIAAVVSALFQHNLKKLLSYHAVSQVGYMVIGVGSGIPLAAAGGIFHMFNHAIYKSLLFMSAGAVEKEAGTSELNKLGGLAKAMPITFLATLCAAFAISGIPPFNGFFSKWMIYQGLIELSAKSPYWVIWITAAMFGSALTLASFIKVIHAVFLGQGSSTLPKVKEASWTMLVPMAVLALFCIAFGLFAKIIPLPYLVFPATGTVALLGQWNPLPALAMLLAGFLAGLTVYLIGGSKKTVSRPAYIGGEILDEEQVRVSGTGFYNTIKEFALFSALYRLAKAGYFDPYAIFGRICLLLSRGLGLFQNGMLSGYLIWTVFGFVLIASLLSFPAATLFSLAVREWWSMAFLAGLFLAIAQRNIYGVVLGMIIMQFSVDRHFESGLLLMFSGALTAMVLFYLALKVREKYQTADLSKIREIRG